MSTSDERHAEEAVRRAIDVLDQPKRSIRAARILWTVAGMATSVAACSRRYALALFGGCELQHRKARLHAAGRGLILTRKPKREPI